MSETRADRFVRELAEVKISDPTAKRGKLWLGLGGVLLLLGPVLALVAYLMSHNTSDPLVQRDTIDIALGAITLSVAGLALYLRYSLTGYLRFWLARQSFDLAQLTDSGSASNTNHDGVRTL